MKCVAALTFVFAALTATSGQASCPAEYLSFSVDAVTQVCVKFYMYVKGTWASMRALCQAEGADLAELRGDLHDQVYSYIFSHSGETTHNSFSLRIGCLFCTNTK
ncbi:uncharacterized protein [Cherax quadricarinatus]|uniref:uncharacterized protein n=1 Tax=Cherax quadricarinatus TaxID=27406 RepID=UPI00387EC394